MFVDERHIHIKAGRGGDGVALFRREIYVPRGGPDGGDGGRGGDIIIEGKRNLHTLSHLASYEKIHAENGLKGGHKQSTGKSGEDVLIFVPLGTVVQQQAEEAWSDVVEIVTEGQTQILAKGGNGGWGNWHFKSSVNQAPTNFNPGLPGEEGDIRLTLKLIADVGLVGLPNAGKSTFLSSVSAARPKIADYPFTTLQPQLGVAQVGVGEDAQNIVIADLPGLIEGASQGKGLGIKFLKHIERTKKIFHFLDSSFEVEEILANYHTIREELQSWSSAVAEKEELIVLTKIDTSLEDEIDEKVQIIQKKLGKKIYLISSASHKGIKELLTASI